MMMKKLIIFCFCIAAISPMTFAQENPVYKEQWFIQSGDTLPYRILLPENYSPKTNYPLIIFLHGSGERGSDNKAQLVHGSKLFLRDSIRKQYPAIIVFPQCPAKSYWSNVDIRTDTLTRKRIFDFKADGEPTMAMRMLLGLITELEKNYTLDRRRYYAGGLSMGGMGTFELVRRKPRMFAAAFPICGGAHTATAPALTRTSWWIFHGLKDDVVYPVFSQQMADAIRQKGGNVKLTLYPEANHNSWDSAFAETMLLSWLFSKHK